MKTYLVLSLPRLFEVIMNKADSCIQPRFLYKQSIVEGEKVTLYIGGEDFIINVPEDDNYDAMYVYSWNHKDPVREEYTILLSNGQNISKRISYFLDGVYVIFDYICAFASDQYNRIFNGSPKLQPILSSKLYSNIPVKHDIYGTDEDVIIYEISEEYKNK